MDSYIYHHGIKGQKWGIRRFQNKDGSLTTAGKKRYSDNSENVERASKEYTKSRKAYKTEYKRWNQKTSGGWVYNKNANARLDKAKTEMSRKKQDLFDEKARNDLYRQTKKSKRQLKLEKKYKNEGMTQEEAALAAYKRVRAERTLAIIGGVALTTAAAVVAYKAYDRIADKVIKSDALLYNISGNSNKGVKDAFYVSMNAYDHTKYRGLYGTQILSSDPANKLYDTTIKVGSRGLKVASPNSATKVLNDLIKSDPEFRKQAMLSMQQTKGGLIGKQNEVLEKGLNDLAKGSSVGNRAYEALNLALVNHNPAGETVSKKFYDALIKNGYDAIKDINDSKYSGYNSINPVIVFNGSAKTSVDSVTNLGKEVVNSNLQKAVAQMIGEKVVKYGSAVAGVYGGLKLADFIGSSTQGTSKKDMEFVRNYRREHPNSKLSNTEILRTRED